MRQQYEPGLDVDPDTLTMWVSFDLYHAVKLKFTSDYVLPFATEELVLDKDEPLTGYKITFHPTVDWVTLSRHLATIPQHGYRRLAAVIQ